MEIYRDPVTDYEIRRYTEGPERNIPLIDLKQNSQELYLALGPEKTAELFVRLAPGRHPDFPDGHDDKTHFNAFGADTVCRLVAEGMRGIPCCAALLKDEDA